MRKILAILVLGILMTSCNQEKTAYVDTSRLLQEYKEMEDVEAEFTTKSDSVRQQLDAAAREFQQKVQEYQSNMNTMSQTERQEKEQELMRMQQMLQQQQQSQGGQLRAQSDAAVDSIVNKVKDYVQQYGEENGYTYIFGSSDSANSIMFAKDEKDLTEEILEKLNADYEAE